MNHLSPERRKILGFLVPALALIALTCLAYLKVFHAGFVWDDRLLIIDNPLVIAHNGLYRFWCTTEAKDYWPLTSSLWWLEWRLFGDHPLGYHVVNLSLHVFDSVLIWMILRQLKIPWSWLAASIFAIHPVNVASVAWISEQKNTLSTFFYLVAILLYLKFDDEGGWPGYLQSLGAFVLALLSKAAVVMLPVVLLGCIWWRRGRLRWRDVLHSVPFFVASLILGFVTVWFQYHRSIEEPITHSERLAVRLAVAGWAPWFYLYKVLWPVNLTVLYPKWQIDGQWISYLPGVLFVGCFMLFWWGRRGWGRPLLFGLGYFVVMLFPVLGFFHQAFHVFSWAADHWQYYSIIGVIALVVAGVHRVWLHLNAGQRRLGGVIGLVVVGALAVATARRSAVYANAESLWRDNLRKEPNDYQAYNFLGATFMQQGQLDEAIQQFNRALQIKPDFAIAEYNLAGAFGRQGRLKETIAHYEQAVRINPNYAEALNNLGYILGQSGDLTGAIAPLERALQIKPNFAEAYYNLGMTLDLAGRTPEAIQHYEKALQLKPDFAVAEFFLANAFLRQGRLNDAIAHYEHVVRLKPDYAEALNNLGFALGQSGDLTGAITRLERSLQIKPDYAEAHYNLGMTFELSGRPQEAIQQYEKALQLKPGFIEVRQRLEELQARH